jgi:hypothetical protein
VRAYGLPDAAFMVIAKNFFIQKKTAARRLRRFPQIKQHKPMGCNSTDWVIKLLSVTAL